MRVVVNQTTALAQKAGIGHYTDQLVRHVRAQAGADRIDTFPTGWVGAACETYSRARSSLYTGRDNHRGSDQDRLRFTARVRQAAVSRLYRAGQSLMSWHFRSLCSRAAYDLYHEPNGIPLPTDRPTLSTLHDLSLLLHPEWHTGERADHFERNLSRTLKQCVHFLTDSDFIRRQVMEKLGVPAAKVTRVHLGIRPGLCPLPPDAVQATLVRLGLPPRYLLYLGTIEPRKNLLPLLRAYCDLPGQLREQWPLLLVGGWGWNARPVADYLREVAGARGVLHLGYLRDEHVASIYNGARALIYPSLYEGFGLPPLEMMACGGAVLASTAGAVVETVGRQAHLVEPEDVIGWRTALARVVSDDDWWRTLRQGAVDLARAFSWEKCAAETLHVYRAICGNAARAAQVSHLPTSMAG
jgi:alpha-1,3-rhamnosyl/mannosyltransferase